MKAFTISISKIIVVTVEAYSESEALAYISDDEMDNTYAEQWYRAEAEKCVLDVEEVQA